MKTDSPRPGALADIGFHALFGIVLGCFFGLVESVTLALRGDSVIDLGAHLPIGLFYAGVWLVWGAALGVVSALGSRIVPAWRDRARRRAFWGTLQILISLVITVGVAVNVRYLPGFQARSSLIFDAAFIVVMAALFFPLRALLLRRFSRVRSGFGLLPYGWGIGAAVLWLVLAALPHFFEIGRPRRTAPPRKGLNVIILLVDALRADQVSAYGYPRGFTPGLDRLARSSALFENVIAQSSRTKEATASILTGRYPSTHGMIYMNSGLPKDLPTLTEVFWHEGFATAILSANTLVTPLFGFDRGVDLFYCARTSVVPSTLVGHLLTKLGTRVPGLGLLKKTVDRAQAVLPPSSNRTIWEGEDARQLNRALLAWLAEDPERSHFAYVHYMEPHAPYDPPPPFDILCDRDSRAGKVKVHPDLGEIRFPYPGAPALGPRESENILALYDGEIASFDDAFRQLERGLAALGIAERTLLLVTADHGEEFYEHKAWGHGHSLYDELLRVPLLVHWPGHVTPGTIERSLVRQVDYYPTVLAAAGVKREIELEGTDLAPLLTGEALPSEITFAFSEIAFGGHRARSLRTEQYKVVHCETGGQEEILFFDLDWDPGEHSDVAETETSSRETLFAELERIREAAAAGAPVSEAVVMDAETEARLRALGYIR